MLLVLVVALATSARAQNGVCGGGTFSKCFDAFVADLKVDPLHCGGCNTRCAQGVSCCLGQCQDCPGGSFKCANNVCTNLQTDPKNCGRCGAACPAGAQCINGACGCPPEKPTSCGTCTNTLIDNNNCGACGIACPSGQSCVNGKCAALGTPAASPAPASPSPSPSPAQPSPSPAGPLPSQPAGVCGSTGTLSKCFDAYVADFMIDPLNCGGCHNVCSQGINCCLGQCQDCSPGFFKCKNNVCTNLGTDPQNCGRCGAACPAGAQCINGACGCPPEKPTSCGTCTNTLTDSLNCGACNKACQGGSTCVNGQCTAAASPSPAAESPIPPGGGCSAACSPGYSCTNGQCQKTVQYLKPKDNINNAIRIAYCLAADGTGCGQPVADLYCQQKGYDRATSFTGPIFKGPTFYLGTQQTCTNSCATFHSIDCVKAQK
ncbi:hypothetical protein N2152v2_010594 [Parachlorella kessleri]